MSALWESIKKGDKDAFIELYDTFYQDFYAYGLKVSGDKELTKDCLQQFFLEIWDRRARLSEVTYLDRYLLRYFKRNLFHEIRERSKTDGLSEHPQEIDFSYEELIIIKQSDENTRNKLRTALGKLTKKQKQVIEMKFFEGLSYEEIADFTSSKNRTVYNLVYEALKVLKEYVKTIVIICLFGA